jgi:hypothetical protein
MTYLGDDMDNIQTYCEWICIQNDGQWTEGALYWFHEDASVDENCFMLVVDENDFPNTKLVRDPSLEELNK